MKGRSLGFGWACAIVLMGTVASARAADNPPVSPHLFTTFNYGLTFPVPRNSFICPHLPTFVGSDHGTDLYLVKPPSCDDGVASAAWDARLPKVQVFYAFNAADMTGPGRPDHPPATDRELMESIMGAQCQDNFAIVDGVTLLKHPALGCFVRHDDAVKLTVGALYSQDESQAPGIPDSMVLVTLDTSERRLSGDMEIFKAVAGGLQRCSAGYYPSNGRIPCPPDGR